MESLKLLLFLTPNTLIVLTMIAWAAAARERWQKHRAPKWFWVELTAVTVLLPQLRSGWPSWWPLLRYLPGAIFKTPLFWVHVGLPQLPALLALPAAFVYRRPPSYLLSTAGAIYLFLFGVIWVFYNKGLTG